MDPYFSPASEFNRNYSGDIVPPAKKVRKNHNEFERKRRDLQRVRLEELRSVIPGLDAKASMVTVLTAAKECIEYLRAQNPSLSFGPRMMPAVAPKLATNISSRASTLNSSNLENEFDLEKLLGLPAELRKTSTDSENSSSNLQGTFKKGRLQLVDGMPTVSPSQFPPEAMTIKVQRAPSPPGGTMAPPMMPNLARNSLIATVMDESYFTGPARKDSALLLPTPDPGTFMFGQRDSMHQFFSVPLPNILEPGHPAYVSCGKCSRGVESLIMIDCDCCHRWYHIRCMDIDPTSIPVRWRCPECPQHYKEVAVQ